MTPHDRRLQLLNAGYSPLPVTARPPFSPIGKRAA
jgi:hypothetical protein